MLCISKHDTKGQVYKWLAAAQNSFNIKKNKQKNYCQDLLKIMGLCLHVFKVVRTSALQISFNGYFSVESNLL